MAIGLDPDEHHVRSIDVHASVDKLPIVVAKMFADVEGLGRFDEVIRRYRLEEQAANEAIDQYAPGDGFVMIERLKDWDFAQASPLTLSRHTCPNCGRQDRCGARLSLDQPYTHIDLRCTGCRRVFGVRAEDVAIEAFEGAETVDRSPYGLPPGTFEIRDTPAPAEPGPTSVRFREFT